MLKSHLKFILRSSLCFLLSLIIASPASAISSYEQSAALNGSYWYNPTGSRSSSCFSSDISIAGSTAAQKIWSGLTTFMTPEQAAGVMGNMTRESNGFNPVQHEVAEHDRYPNLDLVNDSSVHYGIGLIQWSKGRRISLLHYIQSKDPSLISYFQDYNTYSYRYEINGDIFIQKAGADVFDRLVQLELEFLKDELNSNSTYRGIFDQSSVADATKYFLDYIEVPGVALQYIHRGNEGVRDAYYDTLNARTTSAQAFYDQLNGVTLAPSGSDGTNVSGSNVTIIGDSITEGSKSQILVKLPNAEINSEVGRQFSTGIDIAKSINLRSVLVFALGTNNTNLTAAQVQEVIDLAGPTRSVYFVTNYGTNDYTNNNRILNDAASKNSNVNIINWASSVASNPSKYISSDGVHPTADGKELFAQLIANAVTSNNLTNDGCTPSGDFQSTVLAYAWPTWSAPVSSVSAATPKPAYAEAVARRQAAGKYIGVSGIDCGCFVAAVLTDSGFAPDYRSNNESGEDWVIAHGWTLLNPNENTALPDTSILQPGDVAFSNGAVGSAAHTFLYVGDIPGFDSKIASASTGPTWRAPMAGRESLTQSDFGGYPVRWYRKG